jgi:hypothetical protein
MKIRYAGGGAKAAALTLFVALGAAACGGKDDNVNNSNAGRNTNAATARFRRAACMALPNVRGRLGGKGLLIS